MATKQKPDVRFLLDVKPSKYSDTLDVDFNIVLIQDGKIRNPSRYEVGSEFCELHIGSFCERDDAGFSVRHASDGIYYKDLLTVDVRDAEVMLKTLRRLIKGMDKLSSEIGRPQDFASFMAYLARVIGCTDRPFGRLATIGGTGWTYDDNDYRWMDVDDLRYHLHQKIRDWKEGK